MAQGAAVHLLPERGNVVSQLRYACTTCGTWVCDACGWKRPGASVAYRNHTCGRCSSQVGEIIPTMHTEKMWNSHNEGPLPEGHPFGTRPEGDLQAPFGRRTDAPAQESYRRVPVPRSGPYSRLDLTSWKRGVDDALKRYEREIVAVLREADDTQQETDEEGEAEVAWYYYRDRIEDALGLPRGVLNTRAGAASTEGIDTIVASLRAARQETEK